MTNEDELTNIVISHISTGYSPRNLSLRCGKKKPVAVGTLGSQMKTDLFVIHHAIYQLFSLTAFCRDSTDVVLPMTISTTFSPNKVGFDADPYWDGLLGSFLVETIRGCIYFDGLQKVETLFLTLLKKFYIFKLSNYTQFFSFKGP